MPVVHEAPYPDGPTATEYFLPQPEIPDDVRAGLSPWMLYIVTSVKPVALRTINERLSRIEHPDLQPLCEQLRSYTPVSVIFCEDKQSWLRLDSNHTSNKVGTSAYLPPQPDENLIQARLDSAG
ncbi:MAG: hypothetical protein KDA69_08395, partial [Planctomycetaceae bacterium]|nr:hypothetical protein [Planctomycetaceae bacterium]